MEDDRVGSLEAQLAQAKLIAEESDKKYEEVRKHHWRIETFSYCLVLNVINFIKQAYALLNQTFQSIFHITLRILSISSDLMKISKEGYVKLKYSEFIIIFPMGL